ncbi:MAG: DUF2480 family protein [Bacteroidetes bacterium]|jgi:hypothetical protein|nr:DUF2480 family protein [Bacteroidota bacterium]
MSEIVNRVAQSGIVTIDLEELFPAGERVLFDISTQLVEGLLLREKDFRDFIANHAWKEYSGKHVALFCSTDAIVPRWAWMLLSSALQPFAATVVVGNAETLETELFRRMMEQLNPEDYRDQRVVIKGCSHRPVPLQAYVALTAKLQPVVKSILYGEPCSTVPVYKRAKS